MTVEGDKTKDLEVNGNKTRDKIIFVRLSDVHLKVERDNKLG